MSDIQAPLAAPADTITSRREVIAVLATAGATALAGSAEAQPAPQPFRIFNPPNMAKPFGYSHVAEVTSGRTVYISGQIGLDPSGKLAGTPGDFRSQATQVFENLKTALASVGGGFQNLVKLNGYFTNMKDQLPVFREVRDQYISKDAPPASTIVQVGQLAREEFLLEVEVIAVLPSHT